MKKQVDTSTHSSFQFIGAGLSIVAVTYGLARYSYGLFLPDIKQAFGLSFEWMGLIASSSYIGYLISTAIGSIISGRLGPKIPIVLGGICAISGLLLIATAYNKWLLLTGVTVAGMSPGLSYPPLSDAVVLMVKETKRDLAYSIINSGTSLGVMIAAPIALWAGNQWRTAWMVFAVLALFSTTWNYFVIMSSKGVRDSHKGEISKPTLKWLIKRKSSKLFAFTFCFGVVASAFWTYSVEYIASVNKCILISDFEIAENVFSKIFWTGVGISGFAGISASYFIHSFGLRNIIQAGMAIMALSNFILVLFPSNGFSLIISSLFFGGIFILTTAFIGIWSIYVFYDHPSAGFGATFFILSLGQMVGPYFFGIVAEQYNLSMVFYIASIMGGLFSFIKPKEPIYKMTPDDAYIGKKYEKASDSI